MARFAVSAEASSSAGLIKRSAETASEAEYETRSLIRTVGKRGKVFIYQANGRPVSKERLSGLAWAERKARGVPS